MAAGWGYNLLVLAGSLYFFLLYPVAAIYRCGKNEQVGWVAKSIWIVSIAITGPLAAAFYYLRHPAGSISRWIAAVCLLFTGVLAFQSIQSINQMAESASQKLSKDLANLDSAFQANVPPSDRAALTQNLATLQAELKALPWTSVSGRLSLLALEEGLAQMRDRGELSRDDVLFWESLFNDRKTSAVDLEIRIQTRALSGAQN